MRNKIYLLILTALLFITSEVYAVTYEYTVRKDVGTNTPQGTENPNVIDNAIRQLTRLGESDYHELTLTANGTVSTTDTFIIGSSSSAITVSFPSASSVADGTTTKVFVVKNRAAGTMTLSPSVDGVGSPTVSQNQTMSLFTNGTDWFEISANKAYNLAGYIGLGTQTRGTIGLGTQTSGTLSLGTQTSGQLDLGGQTGLISLGTQTNSRLSFGTQTTGKIELGTQTNGSLSLGTQTNGQLDFGGQNGLISLGTQTNSKLSLGTQSAGLLSLGTQTNGLLSIGTQSVGNLAVSRLDGLISLGTQSNGQLDFGGQTGTFSLGTQTNAKLSLGTQTTGKIELGTQTNGFLSLGTQTTGNYLQKWTTGSHTAGGTGTVRFQASGDTVVSSTYNDNGLGTITIALSPGVSSKPDAKVDGVVQVAGPTAYDYPGARFSIAGSGTDAALTFKNVNFGTECSGLLSIGSQSVGNLAVSRLGGPVSIGSQSVGNIEASRVVNLPWTRSGTSVNLGTVTDSVNIGTTTASGTLRVIGTTTITGGSVYIGTTSQSNSSIITIFGSGTSPISFMYNSLQSNAGTNTTSAMIGTSTPSPNTVYASSVQDASYSGYLAFDRGLSNSNRWSSGSVGGIAWLVYDFGTGTVQTINEYRVTSSNPYDPKTWTFEGSVDATSWNVLDTQTNITGWTDSTYKNYPISTGSISAYRAYRINITAGNDPQIITINEMLFLKGNVYDNLPSLYIGGTGTVLVGTTSTNGTTTAYPLQVAGNALASAWNVTCYGDIKSAIAIGTEAVKKGHDDVMAVKVYDYHPKIRNVSMKEAEEVAKAEYVNSFIKTDFETFKANRLGSYTTFKDGSSTVNWKRFNEDFQSIYVIPRYDEFYVLADKDKKIKNTQLDLESDKSIMRSAAISTDPSTPESFKSVQDPRFLDLGNMIAVLIRTTQYQGEEIKDLKARLQAAGL